MDKRQYVALVLREATAWVDSHGESLRVELANLGSVEGVAVSLEAELARALVEIDHLEDVLKHSDLRELPARVWLDASEWPEVLIGAALAALDHDVRRRALDIIEGRVPRMGNIQTY